MSAPRLDLLIIFVHGFLGSEGSFYEFPLHLVQHVTERLAQDVRFTRRGDSCSPPRVEAIVYPCYDTKNRFEFAVKKLRNWLIVHATTARAHHVVLCGHSMGTVVIADTYRLIYKKEVAADARRDAARGATTAPAAADSPTGSGPATSWSLNGTWPVNLISRAATSVGWSATATPRATTTTTTTTTMTTVTTTKEATSLTSQASASPSGSGDAEPAQAGVSSTTTVTTTAVTSTRHEAAVDAESHGAHHRRHHLRPAATGAAEDYDDIRNLINIVGVIAFDSPFFGLSRGVFTLAPLIKLPNVAQDVMAWAYKVLASPEAMVPHLVDYFLPKDLVADGRFDATLEAKAPAEATPIPQDEAGQPVLPEHLRPPPGLDFQQMADWLAQHPCDGERFDATQDGPPPAGPAASTIAAAPTQAIDAAPTQTLELMLSELASSSSPKLSPSDRSLLARYRAAIKALPPTAHRRALLWIISFFMPRSIVPAASFNAAGGFPTGWHQPAVGWADEACRHLEFLLPVLTGSKASVLARVQTLRDAQQHGRLRFAAFYVVLPRRAATSSEAPVPLRHFCVAPPEPVAAHFSTLGTRMNNEIDAHIYMFHAGLAREHYVSLVQRTTQEIVTLLLDHALPAVSRPALTQGETPAPPASA